MSITAYTGLPGHGKTYGVVENVILPALKKGLTVYSNIPMREDLLTRFPGEYVHFDIEHATEEQGYLSSMDGGAVIVLDECWRLWPSGLKANNAPELHKSFLAEHRHKVGKNGASQQIVLVTQDLAQLAAFVRQLVEKTFRVRKLDEVGMEKAFRLDIYSGAATGQNPPGEPIRRIPGKYREEVYQYYYSHTQSETGEAGDESKIDDRANLLKSGLIKIGLPASIAVVAFSVWAIYTMFSEWGGGLEQDESTKRTSTAVSQKTVEVKEVKFQIPVFSTQWRLAAYIENDEQRRAYIVGNGGIREIDPRLCKITEGTKSRFCMVDGEMVTNWTGINSNRWVSVQKEKKG
jgi:zona occludens toxin